MLFYIMLKNDYIIYMNNISDSMSSNINYALKTVSELKELCRGLNIKGYSNKNKADLIAILELSQNIPEPVADSNLQQNVICGDSIKILPTLESESAQIIIADPPYNIGKDFGNDSDKQPMDEYLLWCELWIKECLRILKPNGTMFIYGFSEILALILSKVPYDINRRWILWHYTNKNVPSLNFWQRSHESIIGLQKGVSQKEIKKRHIQHILMELCLEMLLRYQRLLEELV